MTDAKQSSPRRRCSWAEPYKIKVVEPLKISTRAEREQAIALDDDLFLLAVLACLP